MRFATRSDDFHDEACARRQNGFHRLAQRGALQTQFAIIASTLAILSCSPGPSPDGGISDGGISDGGISDGGINDGGINDGGINDGGISDGGISDGGTSDGGTGVTLGGTITGLTASGLTLTDATAGSVQPVAGSTTFVLPAKVIVGTKYDVKVFVQPIGQTCTIANSSGTVPAEGVSDVAVSCAIASNWRWTWMSGSNQYGDAGVYGEIGKASADNTPGARSGSAMWVDASGDLWVFGGRSRKDANYSYYFNDLWRFSTSTNQWTWMKGPSTSDDPGDYGDAGTPAETNLPPARSGPVYWNDADGGLWMYGGRKDDSSPGGPGNFFTDLWQYNPTTNQWVFWAGSTMINQGGTYNNPPDAGDPNYPGARSGYAFWIDSTGTVFLLGGAGYAKAGTTLGYLNDMWSYAPSTKSWQWLGGSDTAGVNGAYGTRGDADAGAMPTSRTGAARWRDSSGTLWLYGGIGYAAPPDTGPKALSDMWKYNPSTNKWTWVAGPSTGDQGNVYGTLGVASATNLPGGRVSMANWVDKSGDLVMFGGSRVGNPLAPTFSDLWTFNTSTLLWTWVSGPNTPNDDGTYGTVTVPSANSYPGATSASTSVVGKDGYVWMFGGARYITNSNIGYRNALWRYTQ